MAVNSVLLGISVNRASAITRSAAISYEILNGESWDKALSGDQDFLVLEMQRAFNSMDRGEEPDFSYYTERDASVKYAVVGNEYRLYRKMEEEDKTD